MNKENAAQFLPLVQALADGKTIQIRFNGKWIDIHDMGLSGFPNDYRIKPEPIEMDVWYHPEDEYLTANSMKGFDGWVKAKATLEFE